MSRNRRDDQRPSSERTAEQRERDRLEREARRARAEGTREPAARATAGTAPTPPPDDDAPTPLQPPPRRAGARGRGGADEQAAAGRGRAGGGEQAAAGRGRAGGGEQPPAGSRAGRRSARAGADDPVELPGRDRAADRRAARRRTPPADRVQPPPVLRIQPEPPAPPAAAAGALGDETDRPIGIRRVQRAVAQRTPRTIVTPPGDVPSGPARTRRSVAARVGGLVALMVLAALVILALLLFQPFGSAQGARVRVVIPAGASASQIGDQLAAAGVVSSGSLFSVRATLAGKRGDLRSGPHMLNHGMTYEAAIDALSKVPGASRAATTRTTIPEGLSRNEIARLPAIEHLHGGYRNASQRFSGRLNPFRYGAPSGTRSLEGFLFPATYELRAGASARDLVGKQLVAFRDNFASVDLRAARRKNLTAYDVLIIASMVEREAQLASERAKIAAVIYNRLKDGVPLGIDATIRYATDNWTRPLRQSELQTDSPFNTRKRDGLPPTPIGNPGLASIRAAAHPANVSYRYYVVQPGACGKHAFSSTFAQFQRDSQRYDQARSAAGGKSPTTC